jgi:dTDP-4-amino-4,6-dideoxygalactose transaminase
MTDIQAAVGREQLKRLPEIVARRRTQVRRYRERLSQIPRLGLPVEPEWASSNWQSFCVRLPAGCDQRQVMQLLLDAGVATRRGIMCAHREPAYAVEPWRCHGSIANAEHRDTACVCLIESELAQDTAITLPLYHQMTEGEQDYVSDALAEICASCSR